MQLDRRQFTVAVMATSAGCTLPRFPETITERRTCACPAKIWIDRQDDRTPGQREALIAILLEGTGGMPGCLSYIVAKDVKDANAIWITEVWDSKDSHAASLKLPAVQAAIAKGRPLIAGFGDYITTEPVRRHRPTQVNRSNQIRAARAA